METGRMSSRSRTSRLTVSCTPGSSFNGRSRESPSRTHSSASCGQRSRFRSATQRLLRRTQGPKRHTRLHHLSPSLERRMPSFVPRVRRPTRSFGFEGWTLRGGGKIFRTRVPLKGPLSFTSATPESDAGPVERAPGERAGLLRLKGRFAYREQKRGDDYWVLADSLHPVLLRAVTGADTLRW